MLEVSKVIFLPSRFLRINYHAEVVPQRKIAERHEQPERSALEALLGWLRTAAPGPADDGVLLLSHGAVPCKLPRLMLAVRRSGLAAPMAQVLLSSVVIRLDSSIARRCFDNLVNFYKLKTSFSNLNCLHN